MLIPSDTRIGVSPPASLSRRVNANSQLGNDAVAEADKLIKKGEC